jgi:Zn-dependent peptidase ImmA (M78 family)
MVDSTIELATDDPEYVKRFSIAHELGHRFLGTTHGSTPEAEAEANAFAGEMLVPGPMLLAALERSPARAELTRAFEVSRSVLDIAAQDHRVAGRLT